MQASPLGHNAVRCPASRAGAPLILSVTATTQKALKSSRKESPPPCLATGGDKPPSGGGPPGKPPGGPSDESGTGDHDPNDDECVGLDEVNFKDLIWKGGVERHEVLWLWV